MSNFITTISFNATDENGKEIVQSMRLVNPSNQMVAVSMSQVMALPNWRDQIHLKKEPVNAVFPTPEAPAETSDAKADNAKGTKAKTGKKKTSAKKKATSAKLNGSTKKKPGRPKAKAA